jgi:hypothetical protein
MADDVDGSPRNAQCSTTASQGTARTIARLGSTASAEGRLESHVSGPVPLFLIPHVVAAEVQKYRDKVVEVRVLRTSGHTYMMNVMLVPERQHGAGTTAKPTAAKQPVPDGSHGTGAAAEQTVEKEEEP